MNEESINRVNKSWTFKIFNRTVFRMTEYYGMIFQVSKSSDCLTGGGTCLQNDISFECMDAKMVKKYKRIAYPIEKFYKLTVGKGFFGIALIRGDKLLGYVCGSNVLTRSFEKYAPYLEPYFYIKYVWVSPEERGKHYARFILSEINRRLGKNLCLSVRCNNVHAIHAYEKAGFEKLFYLKAFSIPLFRWNLALDHCDIKNLEC